MRMIRLKNPEKARGFPYFFVSRNLITQYCECFLPQKDHLKNPVKPFRAGATPISPIDLPAPPAVPVC